MRTSFHNGKAHHTAGGYEINFASLESRIFPSGVCIDKKDTKWHLDWEVIDELREGPTRRVGERAPWASLTHPFDVRVHFRLVVLHQ